MRRIPVVIALIALATPGLALAQGTAGAQKVEPFKLGTFEIEGEPRIGIVLQDKLILDLSTANRVLERNPAYPEIPMPEDMRELVARYEYGMKERLYEIVNAYTSRQQGASRPGYVYDVGKVDTLAPIMPSKMLNAAVNFYSHVGEGGTPEEQKKAAAERKAKRGVPYLFWKPTTGAIIGDGEPIVIPYGRDRVDWEVELGIVIGRTAKYVPATEAEDYIFGYTVHMDVSDRGGRPPGGFGGGSDWFVGKGHDSFSPLGPWIVPKEFYGDPMERLRQTLSVGGQKMQDAQAGDMINNGTSGGTGVGTAYRGEQRFLKPGETVTATIEGIGSLTMPVVGEKEPPKGTGSALPPVKSYRPPSSQQQ